MTRREIRNGPVYNRQGAQPAMENCFADWTKIVKFFEKVWYRHGIKIEKLNITP